MKVLPSREHGILVFPVFLGSGSTQFKRTELNSEFLQVCVLYRGGNRCGSCNFGEIFVFLLISSGCPGSYMQVIGETLV